MVHSQSKGSLPRCISPPYAISPLPELNVLSSSLQMYSRRQTLTNNPKLKEFLWFTQDKLIMFGRLAWKMSNHNLFTTQLILLWWLIPIKNNYRKQLVQEMQTALATEFVLTNPNHTVLPALHQKKKILSNSLWICKDWGSRKVSICMS